jgi:Na+/glutamate symporter
MNIHSYEEYAYIAALGLASDIFIGIIIANILLKQKNKRKKQDEERLKKTAQD